MEIFIKVILGLFGFVSGTFSGYGVLIPLVDNGSGLYENYDKSYIFKGNKVSNYISFNNELWRILSFEADGSIKIIRNSSIGDMAFDDNGFNEWDKSSLKRYLNTKYYNTIDGSYKKMMAFNSVSIPSMDEYLDANSNEKLCGNMDLYFKHYDVCYKSNFINNMALSNSNHAIWTSSIDDGGVNGVYYFGNTYFGDVLPSFSDIGVLPVVYLRSDIKLLGDGTLHKPFVIKKIS